MTAPNRVVIELFGANSNITVPLPFPDAPLLTVIQDTDGEAVHAHPAGVVTVTAWVPALTVMLTGVTR